MFDDFVFNVVLMLLSYAYIVLVIVFSSRMEAVLSVSRKTSRKFLHIMIGNLLFIIPFFTLSFFPALVAAPFILVTFLASHYSPFDALSRKLKGLADITEEGHNLGLFFYAVSYTFLAYFFTSKPYVVAVGVLPMAYGDAVASIIGERYGKRKYVLVARKSLEGSLGMFLVSLVSLFGSLAFFSIFHPFSIMDKVVPTVAAASVATLVEGSSPMGFDNLTVPAFSVLTFLLFGGGA